MTRSRWKLGPLPEGAAPNGTGIVTRIVDYVLAGAKRSSPTEQPPPTRANSADGDVGICLSGGGLRAAAFGLGALQALQDRRGLLRGPEAATWLSAVSGGSYIAGAITLVNAGTRAKRVDGLPIEGTTDLPPGTGPFEPGSPEANHVLRRCRYLIEDGGWKTSLLLGTMLVSGVLVLAILIGWVGTMLLADPALLGPAPADDLRWLVAIAALISYVLLFFIWRRLLRIERLGVRLLLFPVACIPFVLLVLTTPSLAAVIGDLGPLSQPEWWADSFVLVAVVVLVLFLVPILALQVRQTRGAGRLALTANALLLPKILALLGLTWAGFWVWRAMENEASLAGVGIFFGILFLGALVATIDLPGRVSPHRPYRDMLARCFAVVRTGGGAAAVTDPASISLASLAPGERGKTDSFPTLLICAAANVSDIGATAAGTNVLPFVISPSTVGIAGKEWKMATSDLEALKRPAKVASGAEEPVMSLPTAIAITGAAVAPAMGRMTRGHLRPYFVAFNLRLGVWLPNPLSEKARKAVEEHESKPEAGVDQLFLELFGTHRATANSIYVSDGGHYEKLGLVELVRRRCRTVWCVDSSSGKPGRAAALAQALMLAEAETGAEIDIDLSRFDRDPSANTTVGKPRLLSTHAIGRIRYPDGEDGTLIVVKIGLCAETPRMLEEYQAIDTAFPYHSTINQVYRAERFTAYRRLGWDSMCRAISEESQAARKTEQYSSDDGYAFEELSRTG